MLTTRRCIASQDQPRQICHQWVFIQRKICVRDAEGNSGQGKLYHKSLYPKALWPCKILERGSHVVLVDRYDLDESVSLYRVTVAPNPPCSETATPTIPLIIDSDEEVMDLTGPNAEAPTRVEEEPENYPFRTRLVDQSPEVEPTKTGLRTIPLLPPRPYLRISRSNDEETYHPGAPRLRRPFSRFKRLPSVGAVYDHMVEYEPSRGHQVRCYMQGPEDDTCEPREHLPYNLVARFHTSESQFSAQIFALRRGWLVSFPRLHR